MPAIGKPISSAESEWEWGNGMCGVLNVITLIDKIDKCKRFCVSLLFLSHELHNRSAAFNHSATDSPFEILRYTDSRTHTST